MVSIPVTSTLFVYNYIQNKVTKQIMSECLYMTIFVVVINFDEYRSLNDLSFIEHDPHAFSSSLILMNTEVLMTYLSLNMTAILIVIHFPHH